ncbi:MAG: N-6 DNA methylase [Armatimonadetes bacterium]|nr:N-6 DNA methylase [Armatimonadota bacterium]
MISVSNADLQRRIRKVYDHLYANAAFKTPAGICDEVGKILHTAMFLEEEREQNRPAFEFDQVESRHLLDKHEEYRERLAAQCERDFERMNSRWKLYQTGTSLNLQPFDLAYVCTQLSGVLVSDAARDVFGDTLEIIRSEWSKRIGGQFFTDAQVTHLAMTLIDFDPRRGDDLVDICAGSGGFLLAGSVRIRTLLEEGAAGGSVEPEVLQLAVKSLRGQEIDVDVAEVANATLRSRLGSLKTSLVSCGDSLSPDAFRDRKAPLRLGDHECAASNPPFGTKITVKDPAVLGQFELARVYSDRNPALLEEFEEVTPRAPDILFLERNVQMLRPGTGRLAIVLPYQIVSGPQTLFVRRWLIRHCHLVAVIDLPPETFQPHTGTKTSLVVVRRREEPLDDLSQANHDEVFMSCPRWIGHDRRGNPVYRRTDDGLLTDEILTDIPAVESAFKAFQSGEDPSDTHDLAYAVPASVIAGDHLLRINALYHRPSALMKRAEERDSSDWREVRVGDITERVFFPTRFKRNYVDWFPGAVPFLGGSNITELITTSKKWLRPDDPRVAELAVRPGWILITRSGSTGVISSVPRAWDGYAMSEHVIRVVPKADCLEAEYLECYLRSAEGQEALSRGVFGSVIDEINPEFICDLTVPIPRSRQLLEEIVNRLRQSREARDGAIESMISAMSKLERALGHQGVSSVPAPAALPEEARR